MPAKFLQRVLDTVFVEQRPSLIARLMNMVHCPQIAEDLAQEAYLRVSNAVQTGSVEHVQPFLYRTAHNLALDHLRSRRFRSTVEESVPDEQVVSAVASNAPTPETCVLDAERLAALQAALSGLPKRAREVVLLNRLHGLTQQQIAQKLDVAKSTVEKDIRLAMAHCVAHLTHAGLF